MTPPRPLWKSVQDYVLIAIGMISYAIGWSVFLLPTNVTASGLPGISSIIYWATGCPVQIPYFIVNATLLICAFKILGAKFCVKTVYAVIVVTILTSFFSSRLGDVHLLENQPLWAAFLGTRLGEGVIWLCSSLRSGILHRPGGKQQKTKRTVLYHFTEV